MNQQHWLLVSLWILYFVIHSFLADSRVKEMIRNSLGRKFKYYRISYSIFAAIALALLVWYQLSISSKLLFHLSVLQFIAGGIMVVLGLIVMAICIKKYFYQLSGVMEIKEKATVQKLETGGLHRLVRHPLYSGTLLFLWGIFILFPLFSNLLAALMIHLYVLIGIKLEEKKLYEKFGEEYREYAGTVPKLIPFLHPSVPKKEGLL